jgi:hypothetical protein
VDKTPRGALVGLALQFVGIVTVFTAVAVVATKRHRVGCHILGNDLTTALTSECRPGENSRLLTAATLGLVGIALIVIERWLGKSAGLD